MKTYWLRTAATMALFALVVLFVSPSWALGCYCGADSDHHHPAARVHSCCEKCESHPGCAELASVCHCSHADSDVSLISVDKGQFALPIMAAILPGRHTWEVAREATGLPVVFRRETSRPRSPDYSTAAGRAPPASSLS